MPALRRPLRRLTITLAAAGLAAAALASSGSGAATKVACPLDARAAASPRQVQWAFSQYGPALGRRTTSYTHGHGTWLGSRATGWVCHQDMPAGSPKQHVILRVTTSRSALHGMVTRLGKLGVEITLPLVVTATDDAACTVGARARITLFASYYDVHVTRGILRFDEGCPGHDHTFRNPALKVLVTRKGAQVNGP